MGNQLISAEAIRQATSEDIPFLARLELEAASAPLGESFWKTLLASTGTSAARFIEKMFACDASQWGRVEDFLIIESSGKSVAGCAVFRPSDSSGTDSPLDLSKLPQIAQSLGWSQSVANNFEQAYVEMWGDNSSFLQPQAEMIVETVAVLPSHSGLGFGHRLMKAAFEYARQQGATSLGVMVIHGNEPAKALYEKYFERYATFYSAYFEHTFPGLTKYRATL